MFYGYIKKIFKSTNLTAFWIILLIILIYFYKIFLGYIALPVDLLTGAYFPWLDYKWGYAVGVPVKNPGLSDVFNEIYPWKTLAAEQIRSGEFPLWNPYSFSGTPLLANSQATPFYPFNFLLVFLGGVWGWNLLIISTPLLAMVFMYLYLKNLEISFFPSLSGAVIFAFSGFMTTYMEYGTAAQTFLWTPLIFLFIDKYIEKKRIKFLLFISLVFFCAVTSAHFQTLFYMLSLSFAYLLFRIFFEKKLRKKYLKEIVLPITFIFLGIGLGGIQLIPTLELLGLSIRSADVNIFSYNFGLLPFKNILTLFSPDFFGNQSTGNFWGFMVYSETAIYFGIVPLIISIVSLFLVKKDQNFQLRFFSIIFVVSLLLIFENPISKLIYIFKLPVLSTTYATRLSLLLTLSAAFLTAYGLEKIKSNNTAVLKTAIFILSGFVGVLGSLYLSMDILKKGNVDTNTLDLVHYSVALRNSLVPLMVLTVFCLIFYFLRNRLRILYIGIFFLICLDILRFSLKFNVFSPNNLIYPQTPILKFLIDNTANARFERERSEVMPPMSWMPYHLYSASGYDPLYSKQYAQFFNIVNEAKYTDSFTRYAEIDHLNSKFLDLVGAKYIVVVKRDKNNVIDSKVNTLSSKITDPKYKRVFEDKTTVILENTKVMPRVIFYDNFEVEKNYENAYKKLQEGFDFRNKVVLNQEVPFNLQKNDSDKIKIEFYQATKVILSSQTTDTVVGVLTDTYFPGWEVKIDGKKEQILMADGIYKSVVIPKGNHKIEFIYDPSSFKIGLISSLGSLGVINFLFLFFKFKKKNL